MPTYLVTGATGFLGGQLVERLLARDDASVYALVREGSQSRLAAKMRRWPNGENVTPIVGDLSLPSLGVGPEAIQQLAGNVDHLVHLAALYDITTDDATNDLINISGTRHVVE